MSDYSKTTNFTAKDNLTTGDPLKVIKGSYFDTEFDNLATHIATKYDSGNLASTAQAEAGTLDTVLMTPLKTEEWSAVWAAENAGIIGDLQALADPNADVVFGWDDSAGAAIGFTLGTGLESSGTALAVTMGDLTITESQISDLQSYYVSGDSPTFAVITTTGNIELGHATDTTISRVGAGKINVQGKAVLQHDGSYTSGDVTFGTGAATGGSNGDIHFQYTA